MCRPASSCSPSPSCPTPTGRPWELLTCWQPRRRLLGARRAPLVPALRLLLSLPPGALCAARAHSEGLAESRWRRGGGRASQRASGGAAVRRRASGALALTPHPGVEGESGAESTGYPTRLCQWRAGGGERERKLPDSGFRKYPVFSPPSPPPQPAAALAGPPAFSSRATLLSKPLNIGTPKYKERQWVRTRIEVRQGHVAPTQEGALTPSGQVWFGSSGLR